MEHGYLMDTNVVIDFLIGKLPVEAKAKLYSVKPQISVITHVELFSSEKTPANELLKLQKFFNVSVVYNLIDESIVLQASNLRRAFKMKTPDAIIAATAIVNNLTLVTRNEKDFNKINNLNIYNPWVHSA